MLESNLNEGKQSADLAIEEMAYGVSVTDACINFETTEQLLEQATEKLHKVLPQRIKLACTV
jgi:3-deoxy-7-phosphoheptulonate synthase